MNRVEYCYSDWESLQYTIMLYSRTRLHYYCNACDLDSDFVNAYLDAYATNRHVNVRLNH